MNAPRTPVTGHLMLAASTADQLMSANPLSIRGDATVREAVAMLTDHAFNVAPVIDEAGRPVGVLSVTDILVHDREQTRHADLETQPDEGAPRRPARQRGYSVEVIDPTLVRDIMTPVLFSVRLKTPVTEVIERMLALKVHHLFVTDEDGILVGVISPLDILHRLQPS